jgi:hypothetical protein
LAGADHSHNILLTKARRTAIIEATLSGAQASGGRKELPVAVRERTEAHKRQKLLADLLKKYPPIDRLEDLMGPEPPAEEDDEVDAFLRARAGWQQPYPGPEEPA